MYMHMWTARVEFGARAADRLVRSAAARRGYGARTDVDDEIRARTRARATLPRRTRAGARTDIIPLRRFRKPVLY
jgi:hypothetical protein